MVISQAASQQPSDCSTAPECPSVLYYQSSSYVQAGGQAKRRPVSGWMAACEMVTLYTLYPFNTPEEQSKCRSSNLDVGVNRC